MDKWDRLLVRHDGTEVPMLRTRSYLYCLWWSVAFRFIYPDHSKYRGVRIRRHVEF